jgi:hypothetical protein
MYPTQIFFFFFFQRGTQHTSLRTGDTYYVAPCMQERNTVLPRVEPINDTMTTPDRCVVSGVMARRWRRRGGDGCDNPINLHVLSAPMLR